MLGVLTELRRYAVARRRAAEEGRELARQTSFGPPTMERFSRDFEWWRDTQLHPH